MAYANPDIVRQFASAITDEVIADNEIEDLSTNVVDPIINGHLSGQGSPFTTTPTLVGVIASLMCVSIIFNDRYYQTAAESEWGAKKWELAEKLLEQLKSGEIKDTSVGTAPLLSVTDPTDDLASTAVFVGTDETDWKVRSETRASS